MKKMLIVSLLAVVTVAPVFALVGGKAGLRNPRAQAAAAAQDKCGCNNKPRPAARPATMDERCGCNNKPRVGANTTKGCGSCNSCNSCNNKPCCGR